MVVFLNWGTFIGEYKILKSRNLDPYVSRNRVAKPWRHVSMTAFFSVLNKRWGLVVYGAILIMALFSISSLLSYFEDEKKSIAKGENHVKSDHIECFMYNQGILRGKVHASMRSKVYEVTVRKLSCMFMFIFCESVGNH